MMEQDDSLLKTAKKVHGYVYARTEKDIEFIISNNLNGIIELYIDIVPEWKERFGNNAICIFLKPTSLELLEVRLVQRGDDQKFIRGRMQSAILEIKKTEKEYRLIFDYILTLDEDRCKASQ
jgi:guanylate kinase